MVTNDCINNSAPTVLQEICAQRQTRLRELRKHYPEDRVSEAAAGMTRRPRDFTSALQSERATFILECKKASPSKGLIRDEFDPIAIARVYQSYAAAISVLTEPDYFQGDFSYLQAVSAHVQVPVLCKDFIFSRYQVALARYFGADAILLMLSVLDDESYRMLREYAEELGLHILTEVSDVEEMHRANALKAKVIGINHRNLRDLSVDLTRSQKLSEIAWSDAVLIAESGLETNQQVRAIAPYVNGFLVGGALTACADIDAACRSLLFGQHKVCGLTKPNQALAAKAAGASHAGLIFAKRSLRCLSYEQAEAIRSVEGLAYVGVFALEDYASQSALDIAAYISQWARKLELSAVQIHDLPLTAPEQSALASLVTAFRQALPETCQLWCVVSTDHVSELSATFPWVDYWLLDTGSGGSGETFDWQLIPAQGREKILLAGGLNPDNIGEALQLDLAGYDVNSGVENRPGEKCSQRIHHYFQAVRSYGHKARANKLVQENTVN